MLIYECWQAGRPRGACRGWRAERGSAATVGGGRLRSCVSDQLRGRAVLRRQGLATRLSAEPSRCVLLLEAGPNFAPNAWMDSNHRSRALSYTVKAMSVALDHLAKATYSFATGDRWMPKARHTDRSTIRHARRSRSPPPPPTADHFPPTPLHPRRLSFSLESPPA
jgi:hypothetical protein